MNVIFPIALVTTKDISAGMVDNGRFRKRLLYTAAGQNAQYLDK